MLSQISSLISSRWLIHGDFVVSQLPMFVSFLNGNKMGAGDFSEDKTANKPFVISGISLINDTWLLDSQNIPEGSIAVIPVYGVLYASKTQEIANNVLKAQSNPNISAIIFMFNSPGGQVFYTDITAGVIKNCPLPTIGYGMNIVASAAEWLYSACDHRYLSSKLDQVGSIGVMTSWTDWRGLFEEKLGIVMKDFYATKSTAKNNQQRQLQNDNDAPLIADLDYANEIFHQAIIENLGISAESPVFAGDIYYAVEAIKLGLAEDIKTYDQVVEFANKMAAAQQIKSMINTY